MKKTVVLLSLSLLCFTAVASVPGSRAEASVSVGHPSAPPSTVSGAIFLKAFRALCYVEVTDAGKVQQLTLSNVKKDDILYTTSRTLSSPTSFPVDPRAKAVPYSIFERTFTQLGYSAREIGQLAINLTHKQRVNGCQRVPTEIQVFRTVYRHHLKYGIGRETLLILLAVLDFEEATAKLPGRVISYRTLQSRRLPGVKLSKETYIKLANKGKYTWSKAEFEQLWKKEIGLNYAHLVRLLVEIDAYESGRLPLTFTPIVFYRATR